jgi:hypothetical protein
VLSKKKKKNPKPETKQNPKMDTIMSTSQGFSGTVNGDHKMLAVTVLPQMDLLTPRKVRNSCFPHCIFHTESGTQ